MQTGPRKYFLEIGLSVRTKNSIILRPNMFQHADRISDEMREVLASTSIYLICSKPRIRIFPKSFSKIGNDLNFECALHSETGTLVLQRVIPGFFDRFEHVAEITESGIAGAYFALVDQQGENAGHLPTEAFLLWSEEAGDQYFDFEVLYIGQSQRSGISDGVLGRLVNHSTLQRIIVDILTDHPYLEVFILGFEIDEPMYFITGNPFSQATASDEEDKTHVATAIGNPPTSDQMISIAEAAYIRYFQPPYNTRLKNTFPERSMKLLQSCYELDFSGIVAEINTEDIASRIYSRAIPVHFHHMAPYDLHDPDTRESFFLLKSSGGDYVDWRRPKQVSD